MSEAIPQQAADLPEHSAGIRMGKELLKATGPFAAESVPTSWRHVSTTFVLLIAALTGAVILALFFHPPKNGFTEPVIDKPEEMAPPVA
jgi:hypothetical protein